MSKQIIVADDDISVREFTVGLVQSYYPDAVIEQVDDGKPLVERLRQGGIDLVLTDNTMTHLSGTDATREIRSFDSATPIYVVTGDLTRPSVVPGIRAAGATGYFEKPFRIQKLLPYLRQHLGKPVQEPRLNVLHGDDNEDDRAIVQVYLTHALPHAVLTQVSDANAVISAVGDENYDLILTDHDYGSGLDGIDVIKGILQAQPDLFICMVSGSASPEIKLEKKLMALTAGAKAYIDKNSLQAELGVMLQKYFGAVR